MKVNLQQESHEVNCWELSWVLLLSYVSVFRKYKAESILIKITNCTTLLINPCIFLLNGGWLHYCVHPLQHMEIRPWGKNGLHITLSCSWFFTLAMLHVWVTANLKLIKMIVNITQKDHTYTPSDTFSKNPLSPLSNICRQAVAVHQLWVKARCKNLQKAKQHHC